MLGGAYRKERNSMDRKKSEKGKGVYPRRRRRTQCCLWFCKFDFHLIFQKEREPRITVKVSVSRISGSELANKDKRIESVSFSIPERKRPKSRKTQKSGRKKKSPISRQTKIRDYSHFSLERIKIISIHRFLLQSEPLYSIPDFFQ